MDLAPAIDRATCDICRCEGPPRDVIQGDGSRWICRACATRFERPVSAHLRQRYPVVKPRRNFGKVRVR